MPERLKALPDAERLAALRDLSSAADVPIPTTPPPEFQVLSWTDLCSAEKPGVRFGAHSLTHPILSRCDDAHSRFEIVQSVARVAAELTNPSTVFCYPNGRGSDFGEREIAAVRDSGVKAAVSSMAGRIEAEMSAASAEKWRWRIPRLPYDQRRGATARAILARA